jgi:cytidine deaminase
MTSGDHADMEQLLDQAERASDRAYAPYSKLAVGAALLMPNGNVVLGCNVENASYGLTMCAERNAIFRAVAEYGHEPAPTALAVAAAGGIPISPCGACRQVMHEANPDMLVVFRTASGALEQVSVRDLLPHGFSLETGP